MPIGQEHIPTRRRRPQALSFRPAETHQRLDSCLFRHGRRPLCSALGSMGTARQRGSRACQTVVSRTVSNTSFPPNPVPRKLNRSSNAKAVELVPSDRLLVVRLEDGLSWDTICPFLGKPVPDVPYPRENDPKQFMKTTYVHIYQAFASSAMTTLVVLVPLLSASIWYLKA